MNPIPAPVHPQAREEWPDGDFDLPEGHSIHESIIKNYNDEDEDDWDLEMDVGKKSQNLSVSSEPQMRIMRPILDAVDDFDEGPSTIKAGALQRTVKPTPRSPAAEDFEDGFALPDELHQLSLAPTSLSHRSSKNSMEWEDTDQTVSSQSSDAYSTLGLVDTISSTSASSASNSATETDDDDDDTDLEGIVLPSDIFDSSKGSRHLASILALKRDQATDERRIKVASPDDDFEMGLVIDDDVDFSPSRLLFKAQVPHSRSHSVPIQRHMSATRSPSRLKHERGKSAMTPPPPSASSRQLQKARLSSSPPPLRPNRIFSGSQRSPCPSPTPASPSFLIAKPGSLRGQKSHARPDAPTSSRKLSRKSSLSSLDASPVASGSGLGSDSADPTKSRYEESTSASRAKSHRSVSRIMHDWVVPPTRPSTPSNNTAALRLTLPTAGRFKSRPALASIFGSSPAPSPTPMSPPIRTASPQLPSRPPSRIARLSKTLPTGSSLPTAAPAPRVLRKPKRQQVYGDGTELDALDDLPTDREQESRFRVQPKGYGNRIPAGNFSAKHGDKGTIRRKSSRRERSDSSPFKRPSKFDASYLAFSGSSSPPRKKRNTGSQLKRKPTLIRNLGGIGSPKVVGHMKWNPYTLRWEGNDHVLREFDAVVTSTRPALITHLTGSTIGSPVGSTFGAGARRVGNMFFDPARLCWLSTLPPDEDEPDVFANLADDEDDGDIVNRGMLHVFEGGSSCAPSPVKSNSHTRDSSECSEHDRGSRASLVCEVDDDFVQRCRAAEERHTTEMKGWKNSMTKQPDVFSPLDRSFLYMLRDVATRKL